MLLINYGVNTLAKCSPTSGGTTFFLLDTTMVNAYVLHCYVSNAIKIGFLRGGGFPIKKDEILSVIREAFIHMGYKCRSWFTLAS